MGEGTFPALDTHELAWAAGFFDGEGNIRAKFTKVAGRTYCYPGLSANQIDPQVLERFRCAVGGLGKVTGPWDRARYAPNRQSQWCYEVWSFERVQAVVAMLWKWLSPVKREQAKRALLEVRAQHLENVRMQHNSPAAINAAKTHCKLGHPFDEMNTRINSRGHRRCRTCYEGYLERARHGTPNASKTHCKRGHPFDEENTVVDRRGGRQCRICIRIRSRQSQAAFRSRLRQKASIGSEMTSGVSVAVPGTF